MYELIIIWETGEKEIYAFPTRGMAEKTEKEMKKVFGNQISWTGIR